MGRAVLRVESLEARETPDATFHTLFTTQHVDLAFDYAGGAWDVSSETSGGTDFRPDRTLHYVPPAAAVARPGGSQWDFLGAAAGQSLYVLPQNQLSGLLYLGSAAEETESGTFAAYTETDPRVPAVAFPWVAISLAAVRGPGHFSVWQTDAGGNPVVWMSTAQNGVDATDRYFLPEGGHAHFNWGFSAPGFYEIDLRASAYLGPGRTNPTASPVATFYFTVDDRLRVTSVTPTPGGFLARFNRPIDKSVLNLYDAAGGALGPADVTLVGAATGAVRGSLVVPTALVPNPATGAPEWAEALNAVEFVRTGGPLAPDTYTVTLRGENVAFAANAGFKTTAAPPNAGALDGNGDGTTGDSYVGTFAVAAGSARLVGLPDFARGFGQAVNVPADGGGIPVRIDDAAGVTGVTFDLLYDPTLLTVTGGTRGPGVPSGFGVTVDATAAGRARVTFGGGSALPAGPLTLLSLAAGVPAAAPYADKHVLRIENLRINSGAIAGRADDAVHVAAFVGDATGNRSYSGLDAALVSQVAAGQGTGFAAFRNADPVVVADASADGTLGGPDAALVAQKVVGLPVPLIPDPTAGGNPPAGGPDPRLFIPTNLSGAPGATVAVPVRVEVTEPGGVSLRSADYAVSFDPARFTASNARAAGTLLAGFQVVANIDNANGVARVSTYSPNPVPLAGGTVGDVLRLDFAVKPAAAAGASPLNLRAGSGTTRTALDEGQLTLSPAPTDASNDAGVDGTFTVQAGVGVSEFRVGDGTAQRSRVTSLRVAFGSPVPGLTAANFQLTGFGGTLTVAADAANTAYTLTFSGAGTETGSLADGRYTLNVVNVPGLTGPAAFGFHRLFGDANGDGVVNLEDYEQFGNAYGTPDPRFDHNGDGVVNLEDYEQFGNRFGLSV